jgi:hypothetical protein
MRFEEECGTERITRIGWVRMSCVHSFRGWAIGGNNYERVNGSDSTRDVADHGFGNLKTLGRIIIQLVRNLPDGVEMDDGALDVVAVADSPSDG